ncbi:MAG TPA: histidine phosphatase family protein [Caulobacteraceae bacterium]
MERLILFRHGKAEAKGKAPDFERALTEDGRFDAAVIGQALAKADLVPTAALVSPARRTMETWEAARAAFPQARAYPVRELYNATAAEIVGALQGVTAPTVVVVGHNPGLHELAIGLLHEGGASSSVMSKVASRFPTATAIAFAIDENGRAIYDGIFYAADHGGKGGD